MRTAADAVASRAPALDVRVAADGPLVIDASADALREALANLLDNARRHARSAISVELASDGAKYVSYWQSKAQTRATSIAVELLE